MDWQNDPELEELFRGELQERSSRLADGAQAMANDDVSAELIGRMLREGHTIKGTGRVMGYEEIALGGETCEFVWRLIQQGDLEPSPLLGRSMLLLANVLPEALGGDTDPIAESIETIRTVIQKPELLALIPDPNIGEQPAASDRDESEASYVAEPESDVVLDDTDETRSDEHTETTDTLDVATETVDPHQEHVRDPDSSTAAMDPTDEDQTDAESDSDSEPLVFEVGPNGRLATPVITYEVVPDPTHTEVVAVTATPQPPTPVQADVEPLDGPPPLLAVVEDSGSVLDPTSGHSYDLGGLVGAVETWATEESVPVNAGRLFRMINDAAAVRIDVDSVVDQASKLLRSLGTESAVEGILESLESMRLASVQLEGAALGLTVVPISNITNTLPQLVKYLSKKLDRDVELVVEGASTVIDRQLLDRIGEVIRQLVVNAVTHGLESRQVRAAFGKSLVGTITVSISRNDQHLQLVISDDGAGIDWHAVRARAVEGDLVGADPSADDLRSVLYTDGFSTNPNSSEFTGSGLGLGRVTEIVEEVFGSMTLDSVKGRGTSFVITMPAHRALQHAQMFTAGGRMWGIPDAVVVDVIPLPDVAISVSESGSSIVVSGEKVGYASFASIAGLEVDGLPSQVLVLQSPTGLIALAVDEILDTHEVATKDLGPLLKGSSVVSGVALLGGDETVMLVDAGRLAERMRSAKVRSDGPVRRVLVVDDSQGVRQVVSGVLASHGFSTVSAGSVSDALAVLAGTSIDALVVDFSMPRADGVALVHMVRQRYGVIPIVMLSGVASDDDRTRAERAGVDAFFDKADFAKGALVQTLRDLIEEHNAAIEADMEKSIKAS